MIHQDSPRHLPASSMTGALFARKGEAVPVGGRSAPRRVITMRPLTSEQRTPIVLPMPANTVTAEPVHGTAVDDTVIDLSTPVMGPATGCATLHVTRHDAARASTAKAVRKQVRLATGEPAGPVASKRTTLRLDEAMRARLARFSGSETLSVQAVLMRALERFLPAISVERAATASLRLPGNARAGKAGTRRSVRFDAHLYWRLKTAAAKRRCSMQSIMFAALDAYLSAHERTGGAELRPAQQSIVA